MSRRSTLGIVRGRDDEQAKQGSPSLLNGLHESITVCGQVIDGTKLLKHCRIANLCNRHISRSDLNDSRRFSRDLDLGRKSKQSPSEDRSAAQSHVHGFGASHIRCSKGSTTHQAIVTGAFGSHDVTARGPHIHLGAVITKRTVSQIRVNGTDRHYRIISSRVQGTLRAVVSSRSHHHYAVRNSIVNGIFQRARRA